MKNLDLGIFDMDGLMLDTERRYADDIERVMRQLGVTVNMETLWESIGSSEFDEERFFVHIPAGIDAHAAMRQVVPDAVEDMCRRGVPVKKGLNELMAALKARGIPMVVATSTPIEYAGRLLCAAGLYDKLDFVMTRAEVARGKPAPDIFLRACEKAGASPARALVLEDSNNGGRAALAAGIRYIIVPDINPPAVDVAQGAYAVAESLMAVVPMV